MKNKDIELGRFYWERLENDLIEHTFLCGEGSYYRFGNVECLDGCMIDRLNSFLEHLLNASVEERAKYLKRGKEMLQAFEKLFFWDEYEYDKKDGARDIHDLLMLLITLDTSTPHGDTSTPAKDTSTPHYNVKTSEEELKRDYNKLWGKGYIKCSLSSWLYVWTGKGNADGLPITWNGSNSMLATLIDYYAHTETRRWKRAEGGGLFIMGNGKKPYRLANAFDRELRPQRELFELLNDTR